MNPWFKPGLLAGGVLASQDTEAGPLLKGGRRALAERNLVDNAAGKVHELMFLHNTSAGKIARQADMGGMPMPSIAVTKSSIPFEGFGDITLVGKPGSFDPRATKLNQAFSADAYTVRAPHPVRVAKKGAGKAFNEKYGKRLKELGVYTDETIANIWDLETKGRVDSNRYDQVKNFFERNGDELFLDEKGIEFNKDSIADIRNKMDEFRDSGEFKAWSNDKLDEIFEPEDFFISNPNRDYYSDRAKLKPYTADEITKYMKRNAGRNSEGGMASNSIGGVRASTTEELTSLKAMRDRKDRLVSAEEIAEFKQTSDMMLDDLQEAFRPYYKYEKDGWNYGSEFRDFVKISEQKGVARAADEVGFNPPAELVDELNEYKDMLRGGATEYFEAKPKRVVDLNEFGGAIVPQGTDEATLKRLQDAGLQIETYVDEVGRTAAREKFQNLMFQGAGAAVGLGALAPEDAEAGVITKGGKRIIEAWHGSPHKFDKFSMDNIGTGEGAQAYGHGLYFADSEDVARGYRDRLSTFDPYGAKRPKISTVDGTPAQELGQDVWEVADSLASKNISLDDYIAELRVKKSKSANPSRKSVYDDLIEQAEGVRPEIDGRTVKFDQGALYRTHLDVDPDSLLDWDAPLSEQSEAIKGALRDLTDRAGGGRSEGFFDEWLDATDGDFRDWYDNVMESADPAWVTEQLSERGLPGIRYKDGMSRGADGGTSNYVMFDDKPISIVERGSADPRLLAGIAGTGGTAAAMGSLFMSPDEALGQMQSDGLAGGLDLAAAVLSDTGQALYAGGKSAIGSIFGQDAPGTFSDATQDSWYKPKTDAVGAVGGIVEGAMGALMDYKPMLRDQTIGQEIGDAAQWYMNTGRLWLDDNLGEYGRNLTEGLGIGAATFLGLGKPRIR